VEALAALARQQRPDLLVLSGDITQRATPAQFEAAGAFVRRLGVPVLAVPGNHDIPLFDLWTRLRRPYARYSAAFGPDLEPVHRSHAAALARWAEAGADLVMGGHIHLPFVLALHGLARPMWAVQAGTPSRFGYAGARPTR